MMIKKGYGEGSRVKRPKKKVEEAKKKQNYLWDSQWWVYGCTNIHYKVKYI